MIDVTIFTDSNKQYVGFKIIGHAGYADSGSDIVCAAVSTLSVNTVNSIEKFTDDTIEASTDDSVGSLEMKFTSNVSKESKLLIDSMLLGINDIMNSFSKTYIKISYKEV
ncbi:MAG: ribosomal-processing cysteine protease Prp [Clostridiales bacterium]|nr:ribosomal-processing cysteine protease Prp [Clostridiales bacterium]